MSGQRLTPARLVEIRRRNYPQSPAAALVWPWSEFGALLDELDAVTRERDDMTAERNAMRRQRDDIADQRDEALLTLAEWRTDLGPLVAQHRNGNPTADDGPYLPAERDDETIPLGFHDGDAGGQP
jgi:hypothetical protein